jgi:hypothetical protein
MAIQVITSDDLQRFREELLNDIKNIFQKHAPEPYKKWLKSDEVRKLLKVSPGWVGSFFTITITSRKHLQTIFKIPFSKNGKTIDYVIAQAPRCHCQDEENIPEKCQR